MVTLPLSLIFAHPLQGLSPKASSQEKLHATRQAWLNQQPHERLLRPVFLSTAFGIHRRNLNCGVAAHVSEGSRHRDPVGVAAFSPDFAGNPEKQGSVASFRRKKPA